MSYSDTVRQHCLVHFVEPARARGDETVTIRAGDVHMALAFKKRMPLVCSALGSNLFENQYHVERVGVEGPLNGANATFTFRLL